MKENPKDLREALQAGGAGALQALVDAAQPVEGIAPSPTPEARPLMELRSVPPDGAELLKTRMLYRKEGMIVVGQTGGGKSTISLGMALHWGCGRNYLGIEPAGPLKILIIEAEDVEWTNAFMRDGALSAMDPLDASERELLAANVLICEERTHVGPSFFVSVLRPLLEKHRPDLVFINPAFSYLAGEANSGVDVGEFLRTGLNPLLEEFNCGAVVFHHTNKLPGIESDRMRDFNPLYAASGHNEWNNWPRVGIAMMPTKDPEITVLIATKRPKAAGWRDESGGLTNRCHIQRSADPGKPAWTMMACMDARAALSISATSKPGKQRSLTTEQVLKVVRDHDAPAIVKAELSARCEAAYDVRPTTIKDRIKEAIERGLLVVVSKEKRPGGGHAIDYLGFPEAIGGIESANREIPNPAIAGQRPTDLPLI